MWNLSDFQSVELVTPDSMPSPLRTAIAVHVGKVLNEMLSLDRAAVQALWEHRVPCNDKLADHPTVQVKVVAGTPMVGFLGILNGICLDAGSLLVVAAEVDEDNNVQRFLLRPYEECFPK